MSELEVSPMNSSEDSNLDLQRHEMSAEKITSSATWNPSAQKPMTTGSHPSFGEVLPRCSSPFLADLEAFPEVNHDTTGIDGEDTPGHKRVFIRGSGKYFETLAEAVRESEDGDELVLASGMYYETENVFLAKNDITITAAQEGALAASVRVVFSAECCMVSDGMGISVRGITFLQLRTWNGDVKSKDASRAQGCVLVRRGAASFEHCAFSSECAPAIVVLSSAQPSITHSSIQGCKKMAIVCQGTSRPIFADNSIQNNLGFAISVTEESMAEFRNNSITNTVKCAVICGGNSAPTFEGNTVADGTQGGFWIQGRCKCTLRKNVIRNNHKAALQISDQSDPHVEENDIIDGDGGGIVVHGEAKGLYIANKLSGSVRAGIGVMDTARPLFIGNVMTKNQGGGAVMAGNSAPIFVGNQLFENGFVGLGVKEQSVPLLLDNTIVGNVGYGILLQGKSRTEVQGCTVRNNRRAGLCACEEASVQASKCVIQATVEGMQRAGLLMHDDSKAIMEKCQVHGHKTGNVVMQDHSAGSFVDNELANGAIGLKMHARATATLRHNTVRDSRECNLLLLNESQLRATHNTICTGRGAGVRAIQSAVCHLAHNAIVDNGEAGVRLEDAGWVELRQNRVSGNGADGVHLVNSRAKIKHNVIFGNGEAALALRGAGHPVVGGNTLMAGHGEGAQSLEVDSGVNLRGSCTANAVQGTMLASAALSAGQCSHANALVRGREQCWQAVTAGLDALDASQKRPRSVLVEMPDGRLALGEGEVVKGKKPEKARGEREREGDDAVVRTRCTVGRSSSSGSRHRDAP